MIATVRFAAKDLQQKLATDSPLLVCLSRGQHRLLPASSWPSCFLPLQIVDFALLARPNWEETEVSCSLLENNGQCIFNTSPNDIEKASTSMKANAMHFPK